MIALVVSRSPQRRGFVARALGPAWTVHEARDGLEAVRICLADADIGVVIADVATEPMGGFALSRELSYMDDAPGIIVLLERAQDRWLASASRVDDVLVRPFEPFALADAARRLWAKRIHATPTGA